MTPTIINTIQDYLDYKRDYRPFVQMAADGTEINFPVLFPIMVKRTLIRANTYNPNSVATGKKELLKQSIVDNGFAFAIVTIFDEEEEMFVIIDGFHRNLISSEAYLGLEYVPIIVLDHNMAQRMTATVQFNKARGTHQVDLDADVIKALIEQGMDEEEISTHLGIDLDTVHRYKQLTGIADLFKNANWSMSWEMQEVDDEMEIR